MTHTTRRKPPNVRTAAAAVLAVVVAALTLATTSGTSPAQAGARPDFRLPFQCGVKAELKTYYGHNPDDKKIDAYVYGQPTGAPITAMADGYVHESFSPGGIEIRHGGGWFSTYMHMSWHVPAGTWVKQGDRIGTMGDVGSPGSPHLHFEQLYNPNSDQNADNQHITTIVLQGETIVMHPDRPLTRTSTNCGGGGTPPPPTPGKYWVDTFQAAPVFASATSTAQTGTLNQGTNYVYCKVWGREIRNGTSYNHWWLKTDPDSGPANQYVSAYYLSRWGNDEAKDNSGNVIPDCAPPAASKYWVDTYANAPVYASATSTSQTGTLYKGTNYVYCKAKGRTISSGSSYNSYWLKTDPDVGPANQWVSAYYLSRWGNDEAKDNNGTVIPNC
jgi:hypothetical protein